MSQLEMLHRRLFSLEALHWHCGHPFASFISPASQLIRLHPIKDGQWDWHVHVWQPLVSTAYWPLGHCARHSILGHRPPVGSGLHRHIGHWVLWSIWYPSRHLMSQFSWGQVPPDWLHWQSRQPVAGSYSYLLFGHWSWQPRKGQEAQ